MTDDQLLTPGEATHRHAVDRPDEVVLICGRATGGQAHLTRRELDQRAAALAHRLIADGVGPGETVSALDRATRRPSISMTCANSSVEFLITYNNSLIPLQTINIDYLKKN